MVKLCCKMIAKLMSWSIDMKDLSLKLWLLLTLYWWSSHRVTSRCCGCTMNSVSWFRVVYVSRRDELCGEDDGVVKDWHAYHWAAKVRILTTSKWHFEWVFVIAPTHYPLVVTLTSKWARSLVTSPRKAAYQMPDCILISNRFVVIFHRCVAASELSNSLSLKSLSSLSFSVLLCRFALLAIHPSEEHFQKAGTITNSCLLWVCNDSQQYDLTFRPDRSEYWMLW